VFDVLLPHIISAFRAGTKDGYIGVTHACQVGLKRLVRTIRIAHYYVKLFFNYSGQATFYRLIKLTDFPGA